MNYFSHKKLKEFCIDTLVHEGIAEPIAEDVASCLIETSLRGVDSHGIRLLPHYIRVVRSGRINKNPNIKFNQNSKTNGVLDADNTFGHAAASIAVKEAIKMSEEFGSGFVVVKNSTHNSANAYYGLQAARKDMIGISATHSTSMMVSTRGKKPFFGTNALTFAFPCKDEEPICLDMATTQLAWNKVLRAKAKGEILDAPWAIDGHGEVTDNPELAQGLVPAGLHKGYGLAMVVEVLCALLAGGPYGPHLTPMFEKLSEKRHISHFVGAINISNFIDINIFKESLNNMISELRHSDSIDPNLPVLVAGDPEKISEKIRTKEGIPLDEEVISDFNSTITEHSLMQQFKSCFI